MDTQTKKNSTVQLIGIVAALAVLLCFFLPWVEGGRQLCKNQPERLPACNRKRPGRIEHIELDLPVIGSRQHVCSDSSSACHHPWLSSRPSG